MSRKKYRNLTIDDEIWAWSFEGKDNYYGTKILKIWKNKKLIYENYWSHEYGNPWNGYQLTPKKITRFIKLYLQK